MIYTSAYIYKTPCLRGYELTWKVDLSKHTCPIRDWIKRLTYEHRPQPLSDVVTMKSSQMIESLKITNRGQLPHITYGIA